MVLVRLELGHRLATDKHDGIIGHDEVVEDVGLSAPTTLFVEDPHQQPHRLAQVGENATIALAPQHEGQLDVAALGLNDPSHLPAGVADNDVRAASADPPHRIADQHRDDLKGALLGQIQRLEQTLKVQTVASADRELHPPERCAHLGRERGERRFRLSGFFCSHNGVLPYSRGLKSTESPPHTPNGAPGRVTIGFRGAWGALSCVSEAWGPLQGPRASLSTTDPGPGPTGAGGTQSRR